MPDEDDPLDLYDWLLSQFGDDSDDEPEDGQECLTAAERNPSMLRRY